MSEEAVNPEWIPLEEVLDVVSSEQWDWGRNSRCKYLTIRLDTRNGRSLIFDRNGALLTIDELKYQYGEDGEGVSHE